ncbi:hypothetical protein KKD84_00575 [Patescibacteria group bacterium]|nr:hypothetical protein [Patescibacteria group bacterium]
MANILRPPPAGVLASNADKLKISGTDSVGFARDLARKIESFANVIFSDAERDEIYEILTRADVPDKEAHKLHDQSVRELRR